MKIISIVVAFVLALCFFNSSAFAQATSSDIFEPVLDAQNRLQEYYDAVALEEEGKLSEKRTDEQNDLIEEAVISFREAAITLAEKYPDDTEKFLENIEQVESSKRSILRLRFEKSKSPEASSVEYASQVNLDKSYKVLENKVYTATSLTDTLVLRGYAYNSLRNRWTISVKSNFFNYTSLFSIDLPLSYKALTGKEVKSLVKMTKEEREEYERNIMLYDSLFRQAVPVVYVRLKYKIRKWKEASEYRFEPEQLELVRTDTNKTIFTFGKDFLSETTFIVYPRIEIRTASEREADINSAARVLMGEMKTNQEKAVARAESRGQITIVDDKKKHVEQKGRSAVYISTDTRITNSMLNDFEAKDIQLNSIVLNVALGLGKFGFVGGDFGYDYKNRSKENSAYCFGAFGGVNFMPTNFIRPYAELALNYHTDENLTPEIGVGTDILIGKVMLNLGYNFGWKINLENYFDEKEFLDDDISTYHLFTVGFGFTWR